MKRSHSDKLLMFNDLSYSGNKYGSKSLTRAHKSSKIERQATPLYHDRNGFYDESQLSSHCYATFHVLKIYGTILIGTKIEPIRCNYKCIFTFVMFVAIKSLKCGNWWRINLILDHVTSQYSTRKTKQWTLIAKMECFNGNLASQLNKMKKKFMKIVFYLMNLVEMYLIDCYFLREKK